jgi:hypothetical protein
MNFQRCIKGSSNIVSFCELVITADIYLPPNWKELIEP